MDKSSSHYKSRISVLKGEITELYAKRILQDKGFRVRKICSVSRKGGKTTSELNKDIVVDSLKTSDIKQDKIEKIINILEENKSGCPDFICLKGKKLLFVEVKSNKSNIRENQKKTFDNLRRLGFIVNIIRIKIGLDLEEIDRNESYKIELENKQNGYCYDLEGYK